MKYYIIKNEQAQLSIIKVVPVDEANFLEDYGHQIVAFGTTMQEAIIKFAALIEK